MLARLSYEDTPGGRRPGTLRSARLNGQAAVFSQFLEGRAWALATHAGPAPPDLVVVFRGSDDPKSWLMAIRDIDAGYAVFATLVKAIEIRAAAGGRVILVGHSLGGAMVQLFMNAHPDDPHYLAVTFGSPGAQPKPGVFAPRPDPRITNYVVSDDPFVFLGEHRGEFMGYARAHPFRALGVAYGVSEASGASIVGVLAAARDMAHDYVNNGRRVVLPGQSPALSFAGLARAKAQENEIETYIARLARLRLLAGPCAPASSLH